MCGRVALSFAAAAAAAPVAAATIGEHVKDSPKPVVHTPTEYSMSDGVHSTVVRRTHLSIPSSTERTDGG